MGDGEAVSLVTYVYFYRYCAAKYLKRRRRNSAEF
jgi:hypothetical protein